MATQETTALTGDSDPNAPIEGDTTLTNRLFGDAPETVGATETAPTAEPAAADAQTLWASTAAPQEPVTPEETAPTAAPQPVETPRADPAPAAAAPASNSGPGFMALLIGGVVAAAIGFGAAYLGLLSGGGSERDDQIAAAIENQSTALANLQEQVGSLSAPAPEVDLSPVMTQLSGLAERIEGTASTLDTLSNRVGALEARPTLTGEVDEDTAAMAAAMAALEAELGEQRAEAEARAAQVQALAEEAQAAMAEAEARAQASVAAASAQAALSRVRVAMATGEPFQAALSEIDGSVDVSDDLQAAAASGVPTLEELQARFPAAAREALPIALREQSADGTATDRAVAFLRGQFAGRAVAPREGDDPDAILSRAQAAVTAGDLDTALAEIETLDAPAQAALEDWTTAAERRAAADDALDALATALDGAN